jgi:nitrite reductase/ring-hydroxylating ferredoxin subunit
MAFIEVAKTGDIPPGTMKHAEAGEVELLIVNAGGKFYALNDRCTHMNAPLSRGTLDGYTVTCPLHFSRFDVRTGKKISGPAEAEYPGVGKCPPEFLQVLQRIGDAMAPIKTRD